MKRKPTRAEIRKTVLDQVLDQPRQKVAGTLDEHLWGNPRGKFHSWICEYVCEQFDDKLNVQVYGILKQLREQSGRLR